MSLFVIDRTAPDLLFSSAMSPGAGGGKQASGACKAVVARGMRAAGDQSSCPAWGRRGADSGCQDEPLAGGPVA